MMITVIVITLIALLLRVGNILNWQNFSNITITVIQIFGILLWEIALIYRRKVHQEAEQIQTNEIESLLSMLENMKPQIKESEKINEDENQRDNN